jgi:hypothetical protein
MGISRQILLMIWLLLKGIYTDEGTVERMLHVSKLEPSGKEHKIYRMFAAAVKHKTPQNTWNGY